MCNNYLKTKKQVQVSLDLGEGHKLAALGELVQTVEVPAGGQKRVDWRVQSRPAKAKRRFG